MVRNFLGGGSAHFRLFCFSLVCSLVFCFFFCYHRFVGEDFLEEFISTDSWPMYALIASMSGLNFTGSTRGAVSVFYISSSRRLNG